MKALITGGSKGIGSEICIHLGSLGMEIVFFSRNPIHVKVMKDKLDALSITNSGYICDALDLSSLELFWNKMVEDNHIFDILINNVGGGGRWGSQIFHETPMSVWTDILTKNLYSAEYLTSKVLPNMISNKFGRVICISSIYGLYASGRPWYSVAKNGLQVLMKTYAQNPLYARNGVTFNTVAPGSIMTKNTGWDLYKSEHINEFSQYVENLPFGRLGEPKEVAQLIEFLCSGKAQFINGATIPVDGGESAYLFN